MKIMFILWETINGENLATSLEIESTPKEEPKTISDLSTAVTFCLSTPSVFSFLNYALHLSVYKLYDK